MTNVFPFPPPCGACGCNPCKCPPCPPFDKTAFGLVSCFAEVEAFRRLIAQIVREQQQAGIATGPTLGVTDGSVAKPGFVGEYVTGSGVFNFAASPATTTGVLSPIVLQPGDWNITSSMVLSTAYGAASFALSPIPPGMSNNMAGAVLDASPTTSEQSDSIIIGKTAQGSFSVPTLLPFSVTVWQGSGSTLLAGTATLTIEARRMR